MMTRHDPTRQWFLVIITILIVLPVVGALAFLPELETAYLRAFVLPRWEKQFGFRHGTAILRVDNQKHSMFAIEAVTPGSLFSRAGVQAGDIPVGYQHGFESGFYSDLRRFEKGAAIELQLVNGTLQNRRTVLVTP